jgi:hypothetical protein
VDRSPAVSNARDSWTGGALLSASSLLLVSFCLSAVQGTGRDLWASALQVYAFAAFVPSCVGLAGLVRPRFPRAAAVLAVLGTLGSAGGVAYAIDRLQLGTTGMKLQSIGIEGIFALPVPGICFPISLLGLSLALWRARLLGGLPALILGLGAILFPVGNIADIGPIRAVAAVLIFFSLAPLGWSLLRPETATQTARVPVMGKA